MRSLSLYEEKDTFVHRIDPMSKLAYIGFVLLLPMALPYMAVTLGCIFFSVFLLIAGGVLKKTLPVYGVVSFVFITIVIIQGLFGTFNATPAFDIFGLTFYEEGLWYSLRIILRVLNIVSSFLILMFTVDPFEMVDEFVYRGLSPRFGYVISSVFQIIPQMMATVDVIMDAQRSRGMETEGNLLVRVKAFIPLLGPVVLNSFIHTKERAMALEVRGFGAKNKRSFLKERRVYKPGRIMQLCFAVLLAAAVVIRFVYKF